MSRINIVAEDNMVIIDGDAEEVAFIGDPNIHSISWDDVLEIGEVEYVGRNRENEVITNFAPYQHYVGDHGNSKTAREAAEVAGKQQEQDDRDALNVQGEQDRQDAMSPQEKAYEEYPPLHEQLYALYKSRQGDNTMLDAIDVAIDAVDQVHNL